MFILRRLGGIQNPRKRWQTSPTAAAAAKSPQSCPTAWPHGLQPTRLLCPWDSPGKNNGVGCHFLLQCIKVKSQSEVAQSCLTLSDPMDCSLPGSSIHGIFQARVLEWGAIAFSKTCPKKIIIIYYFKNINIIPLKNIHLLPIVLFPSPSLLCSLYNRPMNPRD